MTKNNKKTVRIHFVNFYQNDLIRKEFCEYFSDRYDFITDEQNPQFLFCGSMLQPDQNLFSPHIFYGGRHCCKIFMAGENILPDFNFYDYAIAFAPLELGDRYLRFFGETNFIRKTRTPDLITDEWCELSKERVFREKTGFCNFIYSNPALQGPEREQFFHLLSQYKKVTSAGRFLQNTDKLIKQEQQTGIHPHYKRDLKVNFIKHDKFTIAFENISAPGYVTEKIIHPFEARTVPIYWGNPDIAKDFEPGSFINAHDFESLEALVEEVKRIDQDDEAYMKMLNTYPILKKYQGPGCSLSERRKAFLCRILDQEPEMLIRRVAVESPLPFIISRILSRKELRWGLKILRASIKIVFYSVISVIKKIRNIKTGIFE